jgi:DNA polymerase-3 subunit delta'
MDGTDEESVAPAAAPRAFGPARAAGAAAAFGLSAVVGHEVARRLLSERLRAGTLPHALLLVGPRGVGKRTFAQALVAEHFCRERRGCGTCAACGALLRGNHPGFVTVEAPAGKSAIPIDAIKTLEREISLRPADERGRFTLIRGADRMTPSAQDALLKTLEEPPPANVLVLTAVRADAVLATIRSRCQRIALAPLADAELAEVARRLGRTPGVPASVARGCPGQLERLADPRFERLREGVVRLLAAPRGREDLARIVALLHETLPKEAEPAEVRAAAHELLELVGSFVRDLVVLRASGAADRVRNSDHLDRLAALAGRSEWADAFGALRRLARARDRIDGNVDPASSLLGLLRPGTEDVAREDGIGAGA